MWSLQSRLKTERIGHADFVLNKLVVLAQSVVVMTAMDLQLVRKRMMGPDSVRWPYAIEIRDSIHIYENQVLKLGRPFRRHKAVRT